MSKRRIFAALGVAGLVAAGSSAFTAAVTVPNDEAGYGVATITGATVSSIDYTFDATGEVVVGVVLVVVGDVSPSVASVGLNGSSTVDCGAGVVATDTTYTCDVSSINQSTATWTTTEVVIN